MSKISVVVPTFNKAKLLKKCLDSLFNQTLDKKDYEIIVVDDGSKDETIQLLAKYNYPNFRYYRQKHKGAAAARNLGIRNAKSEIIAFTDSDCIVDKNWLNELIKSFESPDVIGVAGKVISINENITPFTHQVINNGEFFASCNIACRKNSLIKVGKFDENFVYGHEDTDLAIRLAKLGRLLYNNSAIVTHIPIPIGFCGLINRVAIFYRNESLLYNKHPELYNRHNRFRVLIRTFGRISFQGIKFHIHFVYRNPIIFLLYLIALVLQACFLAILINEEQSIRK